MEEKPRSSTTHALNYGLITGAILIVFSLILFIANLYMNKGMSFVGYAILLGGMILGTLEYRKKHLNGFMSYGQAFSLGFKIGLFAGIVSSIYMFFFAQYINPGFPQELLDQARQGMMERSGEMTEEQMDQALSMTAKFMSPPMLAVFGLLYYIIFSAIVSLITAIFLKKEDKSLNTLV
jgi:hypothetical protein